MNRLLMLLLAAATLLMPLKGWSVAIYVAAKGDDAAAGTTDHPLASVSAALRMARNLRRLNDPSVKEGVHIIVGEGVYPLLETLVIRPEDSGTEASPTCIEAAPGARPILSGGVAVTGWHKAVGSIRGLPSAAKGNVWVADVPVTGGPLLNFRQLWVNDRKATRARESDADSMSRILSWNHQAQTCWIPRPRTADLTDAAGMELFIHQWWAIAILRIKAVRVQGDSAELSFFQPESRIQSEHPWPAPWISAKTGNSAFYLTNAIQFLNRPGEWYLDIKNQQLYYWPKKDENLLTAHAVIPLLQTLVKMQGTIDNPVSHVFFKGISFEHSGWLRPSQEGHVPHQAGMYMLDAYKLVRPGTPDKKGLENQAWLGRPAAAVEVTYAHHTGFEACRFQHLASTGLDYARGTHDDEITGNLFKDIGGTGILTGMFSDEAFETHRPYNPADLREVCTGDRFTNNLVTDVTNEDWGCVGIGAGYVKGIRIAHNEVAHVNYTGISMGWGWTKAVNAMSNNLVYANKIHHYARNMYDVAGIYTLSAQPGSVISDNYVDSIYKAPYAHDPNHWFYLYLDEGSSYITVADNWCPAEKFLKNANGPGNTWENNGPAVADSIKKKAGLEPNYRHWLNEVASDPSWPVNSAALVAPSAAAAPGNTSGYAAANKPFVVEVAGKTGAALPLAGLMEILKQHTIPTADLYRWKHHLAAFGMIPDTLSLRREIVSRFPQVTVKIYHDPFYAFTRESCKETATAAAWDNILLTASLVKDTVLQQEYLQYHADQQKKWPEVAAGFCNAQFQQLLVFKNGRQLMLVISIPKGASLDSLNPKTTENNPRMNQWNDMMKKYQEGIPGTGPGEVWVELQPVADLK